MITIYLVCKNGSHDEPVKDEIVNKFELETDYKEGLKMLRCITNIFKDWVKLSKVLGRTK